LEKSGPSRHPHKVENLGSNPRPATNFVRRKATHTGTQSDPRVLMKTHLYQKEKVKIIKELNIKDKDGKWVQIEFLTGDRKGNRIPVCSEDLK
jgi:hypothetical protein